MTLLCVGPRADHQQVGAGGLAGQYVAGMAADDLLADRDFGVLVPPSIDNFRQVGGGGCFIGRGEDARIAGGIGAFHGHDHRLGLVRVLIVPESSPREPFQGVNGGQPGAAHRRLVEGEPEAVGGLRRVPDSDDDLGVHGHTVLGGDHDRAGCMRGHIAAHRTQHHRAETACPAGPEDQHRRP